MTFDDETMTREYLDGEVVEVWARNTPEERRVWRSRGKIHRDGAPAIKWVDGSRMWFRDGLAHREDGPAYERADGLRCWYLLGERIEESALRDKVLALREAEALFAQHSLYPPGK